jgi:hypothetical protein
MTKAKKKKKKKGLGVGVPAKQDKVLSLNPRIAKKAKQTNRERCRDEV